MLWKVKAIFGFNGSDNIGKTAFPAVQACPAFPSTFHIPFRGALDMPCLIPCAIDQVSGREENETETERRRQIQRRRDRESSRETVIEREITNEREEVNGSETRESRGKKKRGEERIG